LRPENEPCSGLFLQARDFGGRCAQRPHLFEIHIVHDDKILEGIEILWGDLTLRPSVAGKPLNFKQKPPSDKPNLMEQFHQCQHKKFLPRSKRKRRK